MSDGQEWSSQWYVLTRISSKGEAETYPASQEMDIPINSLHSLGFTVMPLVTTVTVSSMITINCTNTFPVGGWALLSGNGHSKQYTESSSS